MDFEGGRKDWEMSKGMELWKFQRRVDNPSWWEGRVWGELVGAGWGHVVGQNMVKWPWTPSKEAKMPLKGFGGGGGDLT